jgi:hypothetical protein
MQFRIWTLLVITAAVSVLCAMMFTAPLVVAAPILLGLLWISPSLWINGIIYGRGAWRPFFIGGTMAALVPHLVAIYFSVMAGALIVGGDTGEITELYPAWPNMYVSLIFLGPGPFAILGGLVGVWTWWMNRPPSASATRSNPRHQESAADAKPADYVVISGRLSAIRPVAEPSLHGSAASPATTADADYAHRS